QRRQRCRQGALSFQPRLARYVLPRKQEAQEVARRNWLDLRAQALDRVMVDAGEQPPVAPLFVIDTLNEPPAQNRALGLQRRPRRPHRVRLQPERRRQRGRCDWTRSLQTAADDFGQRLLSGPYVLLSLRPRRGGSRRRRQRNVRLAPRVRPYGVELIHPL